MKDTSKTKQQLVIELAEARQQISEMQTIISKHIPTEEETLVSEQRYMRLIEQAGDGVFVLNRDQRFIIVNSKICEMLGYTKDELRNLTILDTYPDEIFEPARKRQELIKSVGSLRFERPMKRKDGESFLVEVSATVLKDGTFQGIVHDITARKQVEEALRKSEERYRTIFENTGNASVLLGADTTILLANSNFEKLSGFSKEELESKISWTSFVDKEDLARMRQYHEMRRKESGSAPESYEFRFINRNGVMKYIFLTIAMIPGTNDSIASLMDITERKLAEKTLQEKTEELDRFFSVALDLLCIADTDGNFRLLNPAWERTLGYTRDELMSRKFIDFIHPDDVKTTLEAIEILVSQREVINFHNRYRCKDGTYRWIEWRSVPAGKLIYAAARDITERKLAEDALRAVAREWQITFDAVGSAVWLLDENQRIIRANNATSLIFGKEPGEVIGHFCWEIVHRSSSPIAECPVKRVQDSLQRESMELPMGENWLEVVVDPILNDDGRIQGLIHIVSDITERKRAEEELLKQTTLFRNLFESSPEAIAVLDHEDRVVEVNHSFATLFGYSPLETKGRFINELLAPEPYLEDAQVVSKTVIGDGKIVEKEAIRCTKDGRPVHVSLIGYPIVLNGREIGAYAIYRDITKQKKAEEELKIFKESLENSTDAIGMSTPQGRHYYQNKAFSKMFGNIGEYPPETVYVDKKIGDEVFKTAMSGRQWTGEVKMYSINKEILDIYLRAYANEDINGKVTALVGIHTDITERKHAEEELRESERRYRQLIEQAPEGILFHEADGRFILVNSKLCEMLGYTEEEILQLNILDTYPDEIREECVKRLAYLKSGDSLRFERPMKRKDGSVFYIEASALKLPDGRIQGIVQDITLRIQAEEEKRRLETQLIQSQKMESIGTLAGGIAHDFNNILAAIIGYSELAFDDVSNPEKAKAEIREVLKSGERARDLVGQILTFSRRKEITYSPISMSSVIKESLKMLRSVIPTTIEIRQGVIDSGLVMSDSTQINQLIMNLCTNAAHAMDELGGVLEVSLNKVIIDDRTASSLNLALGPYMKLSVSDTGNGITPDVIEKIFEPYFTTKELGRGTGLGLSVVHGIVKSHKGAVLCSSAPGKGTTFDVYLPEIESILGPSRADEDRVYPTGSERILFIDDEPALANLAEMMLKRLGYSIVTKTSSKEALELFRKDPEAFDLVITDMTMPGMRGDLLVGEIIEIRNDIPVILCTGYSEHISEERAKEIGIQEYVMKPIEMKVLAKTIRKVLDGEYYN
jgi:PAS domain S-box-containing protein